MNKASLEPLGVRVEYAVEAEDMPKAVPRLPTLFIVPGLARGA